MIKFKILFLLTSIIFVSCIKKKENYKKTYYPTGELYSKVKYKNGKTIDTTYFYYKNGVVREKGILDDKLQLEKGWWFYYNKRGDLRVKNEYKIIRDSVYKNQTIHYNLDGSINKKNSSYYTIKLPDTIYLGKTLGDLYYSSNFNKIKKKELFVIIDNNYNGIIKKDTFIDETPEYTFFGIYADKIGEKIIRGEIIEQLFKYDTVNTQNLSLKILEHKKYFEIEVYVKDTIE